ncbi:hypothetical protein [Mycobacterium kansasii]|uniref:hypothetical protein n=1 Tax=Mycobacterium kansasii TaxID=1768 RepID=UPI003A860272
MDENIPELLKRCMHWPVDGFVRRIVKDGTFHGQQEVTWLKGRAMGRALVGHSPPGQAPADVTATVYPLGSLVSVKLHSREGLPCIAVTFAAGDVLEVNASEFGTEIQAAEDFVVAVLDAIGSIADER